MGKGSKLWRHPVTKGVLGAGIVLAGGWLVDSLLLPALIHSRPVVRMPSVIGLSLQEAIAMLTAQSFVVQEIHYEAHPSIPEQHVIRQVPAPGSLVRQGRRVYLTVSTGGRQRLLPNLVGLSLRQAQLQLLQQGFQLSQIVSEFHDSLPAGTVVRQNPPPSTPVASGTAVSLVVSQGPTPSVVVPNLLSLSLAEAQALLEQLGLKLGQVVAVSDPTFLPNTVIGQQPAEGTVVASGSTVSLTVAR